MSTHNIGFFEDLTKIIFELSSNTHLIFFAALASFCDGCTILVCVAAKTDSHTEVRLIQKMNN